MEKIGLEGVFKTEAFASGLSKYTSGLSSAASSTASTANKLVSSIGGAVMGVGTAFLAIGTAAVAASGIVVGAITKMVFSASQMGDAYSKMSLVTGISTTRLQELTYAGKLLDVEVETITSGMRFLTRNMYSARDGTGETAEAFKALGIRVLDAEGNLRDSNVVFGETIDALGKMENPTEADAIAMKIMGRSAMELNPLIKAGSAQLAKYSAEAHDMGAVIDEDVIASLDVFQDQMDAMKLSFRVISAKIGAQFLPAFQGIVTLFRNKLSDPATQAWLKNLTTGIGDFTSKILGGQGLSAALSGIAPLFESLPSLGEILSGIFKAGGDFSESIKAWADGIVWDDVWKSLADGISAIPWTEMGTQTGRIARNLISALKTVFESGEIKTAIGEMGLGIGDFIASAIVPGKGWKLAWQTQWDGTLDLMAKTINEYGWWDIGKEMANMLFAGWWQTLVTRTMGMAKKIFDLFFSGDPFFSYSELPGGTKTKGKSGGPTVITPLELPDYIPNIFPDAYQNPAPLPQIFPLRLTPAPMNIPATSAPVFNTNIYNPVSEPVSLSVKALKKINYLGVP
jgi:hypothetical protein